MARTLPFLALLLLPRLALAFVLGEWELRVHLAGEPAVQVVQVQVKASQGAAWRFSVRMAPLGTPDPWGPRRP